MTENWPVSRTNSVPWSSSQRQSSGLTSGTSCQPSAQFVIALELVCASISWNGCQRQTKHAVSALLSVVRRFRHLWRRLNPGQRATSQFSWDTRWVGLWLRSMRLPHPAPSTASFFLVRPCALERMRARFATPLFSLVPKPVSDSDPYPGSILSHASAAASPHTFIWSRLMDAIQSAGDGRAVDIHARIERWALDEVALPGKLVREIVDALYRENQFCRGTLRVGGRMIGPSSLSVQTLAVVNTADAVAPLVSLNPIRDVWALKDRISSNTTAKQAFACSILEFWSGARRLRVSGPRSSAGSMLEGHVPAQVNSRALRGRCPVHCMKIRIQLPIRPLAVMTAAARAMCLTNSEVTLAPRFLATK